MDLYGPAAMRAWYRGTLGDLIAADPRSIAAELAAAAAGRRLSPNPESLDAWLGSVRLLQSAAIDIIAGEASAAGWWYFLEFEIPRRRRRIDVVIAADDVLFFVEWKVGATRFDRASLWQAQQYTLDMRDFFEGCGDRPLVPVLVATAAPTPSEVTVPDLQRLVQPVLSLTPDALPAVIIDFARALHREDASVPSPAEWEDGEYRPTPSIIEAAKALYEAHDVRDLSLSGASNLDSTVDAILELVERCRRERRRGIAFITGAPGSGKTLAGLQVVHTPELMSDEEAAGVFLSGNMPLVEVISAALARSAAQGSRRSLRDARREVTAFIQHAYVFRNEYAEEEARIPSEHVVLFDEAQRAWDAHQVTAWTRGASTRSEPRILLDVMSRVPGWSVVIGMVGGGQEINRGEAGLREWGRAIEAFHPDWLVMASPAVLPGAPTPPGGRLFDEEPPSLSIQRETRLHLQMNVRSPRAERLNQWVDAVLSMSIEEARALCPDPREYPMAVTRSLADAKQWLRDRAGEGQRTGLVASSEARRLRAWGLDVPLLRREKKWADWFLRERHDVRGSDQLEVAATNFDCQGLEIDWAGVCWSNDFLPDRVDSRWRTRRFVGSAWQNATGDRARYLVNGYRVILTRARRGQVIWVPRPDGRDSTLPPRDFDAIADLLMAAGVPPLN